MIHQIVEGRTTWLPGFSFQDIPRNLPRSISVRVRNGEIGLESNGIVGAFPCPNGDTIQIVPKIGPVNFMRLLFRAQGQLNETKKEFDEFVKYYITDELALDAIIAVNLFERVAEILCRSELTNRVASKHKGDFCRGKLVPIQSFLNLSLNVNKPLISSIKQKTGDIAENRIISAAIVRAWAYLTQSDKNKYNFVRDRWLKKFPKSKFLERDLELIAQKSSRGGYGGSRDYYRRALTLSHVILSMQGMGYSGDVKEFGDSLLINTAEVFEKYLRQIISESLTEKGYVVSKGTNMFPSLYADGSFGLEPDILVMKNNRVVLMLDAKYKKPDASDHYQMHAYINAAGLTCGVLLAPSQSNSVERFDYSTEDGKIISEYLLPMENLSETEVALEEVLNEFG